MKLTTELLYQTPTCTISELSVDGKPQCYILQDGHRDVKVAGETRVPAGEYEVVLYKKGVMHPQYETRYGKKFHKGMLLLKGVPGFEGILIHVGNTPKDTRGCLLPGTKADYKNEIVAGSRPAYEKLYAIVRDALVCGEPVTIKVEY